VDKAYVDKTFNGINWFKYRETTIKKTSMAGAYTRSLHSST